MICPNKSCGQEILDDSTFCDQCGSAILVCEKCGALGVNKFHAADGGRMVQRKVALVDETPSPAPSPSPTPTPLIVDPAPQSMPSPAPTQAPPTGQKTQVYTGAPAVLKLRHTSGAVVNIAGNAVVSRENGPLSALLAPTGFASRNHAELSVQGGNWIVKDLGSTNGTLINDQKCAPNVELPLKGGMKLQFADQSFTVELS